MSESKALNIHQASKKHQQLDDEGLEKSGVKEELVRLAVGLESTDDTLKALDEAISIATGEEQQIKTTEKDAAQWLLQSPFDRSGDVRQKVIAAIGLGDEATETISKLQSAGYQVLTLEDGTTNIDVDVVDAVWIGNYTLSDNDIQALKEKQVKIVWSEKSIDQTALQQTDFVLIENKSILEEFTYFKTNH